MLDDGHEIAYRGRLPANGNSWLLSSAGDCGQGAAARWGGMRMATVLIANGRF